MRYTHKFPSYEQIKEYKNSKKHIEQMLVLFTKIGGYFQLTVNEEHNMMSIDYIAEDGYLKYINGMGRDAKYRISKLYPINKKTYDGLYKLYREVLNKILEEIREVVKEVEKDGKEI